MNEKNFESGVESREAGSENPTGKVVLTCSACGYVRVLTPDEAANVTEYGLIITFREPYVTHQFGFTCPQCTCEVKVDKKDLPFQVKVAVVDRARERMFASQHRPMMVPGRWTEKNDES